VTTVYGDEPTAIVFGEETCGLESICGRQKAAYVTKNKDPRLNPGRLMRHPYKTDTTAYHQVQCALWWPDRVKWKQQSRIRTVWGPPRRPLVRRRPLGPATNLP